MNFPSLAGLKTNRILIQPLFIEYSFNSADFAWQNLPPSVHLLGFVFWKEAETNTVSHHALPASGNTQ